MALVRGGRGQGRGRLQEGEAPDAHVAEEGKKVIKDLVARQTSNVATLEQQRAREREREFHRAAAVLPLAEVSSGTSSLQEFTASAERIKRTEELVGKGLPLHDLQLLLEHEQGLLGAAMRLAEPQRLAREEKIREIQRRLSSEASGSSSVPGGQADGVPDRDAPPNIAKSAVSKPSSSAPGQSRHVQELASKLHLDSEMSPFVRMALSKAQSGLGDDVDDDDGVPRFRDAAQPASGHPVHRLRTLERDMFGQLDTAGPPPPAATSRKRRRQRQAVDQPKDALRGGIARECVGVEAGGSGGSVRGGSGSLWDVRDPRQAELRARQTTKRANVETSVPAGVHAQSRPYGPARQKQYTIKDGRIVAVDSKTHSVAGDRRDSSANKRPPGPTGEVFIPTGRGAFTPDQLQHDRLTVDEIRQLPRFSAYEEGSISTILYVKNLDGAATEDDLAEVFGSFQTPDAPSITFRLCGGRMRGQAFVTFPNQEAATSALAATNGYILKGRPMIVQYGRKQS